MKKVWILFFYHMLFLSNKQEGIQMNVQNLQDNYPKLISYMENNGYSKTYVDRFKREITKIMVLADSEDWSCYTDVYLEYTKTPHSPDYSNPAMVKVPSSRRTPLSPKLSYSSGVEQSPNFDSSKGIICTSSSKICRFQQSFSVLFNNIVSKFPWLDV